MAMAKEGKVSRTNWYTGNHKKLGKDSLTSFFQTVIEATGRWRMVKNSFHLRGNGIFVSTMQFCCFDNAIACITGGGRAIFRKAQKKWWCWKTTTAFSKALEPPAPDPPAPGAPPMALVVCSEAVWRGMDRVDEMVMLWWMMLILLMYSSCMSI